MYYEVTCNKCGYNYPNHLLHICTGMPNTAILEHLREIRNEKDQAMRDYRIDVLIWQLSGGEAPKMPKI